MNGPHNTYEPYESAKPWMAESRKTFPRQNCRHYWLLQMTNKIKHLFALTDKGIEFVFTSFLYINLVIMFLFVLEVRLHSFGQIHFCSFPFHPWRDSFWIHFAAWTAEARVSSEDMIDHCSFGHNLRSCEIKEWKKNQLGLNGIRGNHDLCDTGAVQAWILSGFKFTTA